jgi:soluble lytic murein transglycosylase
LTDSQRAHHRPLLRYLTTASFAVLLLAVPVATFAQTDKPAAAKESSPKQATAKPAAAKQTTAAKPAASKQSSAKPSEAKPSEAKPSEAKPSEAKPAAAKPVAAAKPAAAKPAAPKQVDAKKPETKPSAAAPKTAGPVVGVFRTAAPKTASSKPAQIPVPRPRPAPTVAAVPTVVASAAPGEVLAAATEAAAPQPAEQSWNPFRTASLPPQPRQAPASGRRSAPAAIASSTATSQQDFDTLERAIEMSRSGKAADATQLRDSIQDPVAQKLVEWMILRSEGNGASAERYRAFTEANPGWPSTGFLRRRGEAALWDNNRDDSAVLAWFGNEQPTSAKGRFMLARALLARGDRNAALRYVRDAWRGDPMSKDTEAYALEMFGSLLTAADHKARMDYLLFTDDTAGALRAAQRVGASQVAIAKARMAVDDKAGNAKALLDAVPSDAQGDASYLFGRIQLLRRADKITEAAQFMMHAPRDPAKLGNPDEWWIERRLLARKLLDLGEAQTAYAVARDAGLPARDVYKTEQEFTAGWIALRFLKDPSTGLQHFSRIGTGSSNPTHLSRAGYWQGRAYEALGRSQDARAAYQSAAHHSTSYYGQLARAKLGLPQLGLRDAPRPARGTSFEVVRAVELLYKLDERDLVGTMLSDLSDRLDDIDALASLGEVTARNNDARNMLVLGKGALNRGYPFDHYAYPISGIPKYDMIGPEVERGLVFAIARQESAFNPKALSPAKAMGLMQVTPPAAKTIHRRYGGSYDIKRLQNDPAYNAMLGAAELGALVSDYRGSYILTFVGYNAGRGRAKEWIAKYGDPRDPNVDAVDWVERIPFSETRNYVQRIMENVQVYRSRFGGGSKLMIDADLKRGTPGATEQVVTSEQ